MKPKKYLGQNFLTNKKTVEKIVASVDLKHKTVFEVGPGKGALTEELAKGAKDVYAFEIDKSLDKYLKPLKNKYANLEIIYEDILKVDLNEFIQEKSVDDITIVANIPYYITGPLLNKFKDLQAVTTLVIMMQKEVAERILAKPKEKAYGKLTVVFNYHFKIGKVVDVKKTNFFPMPKVDSTVLKFIRTNKYLNMTKSTNVFYEFVEAAFKMKRKTLVNNLKSFYKMSSEEVQEKLLKIDPTFNPLKRAEDIDLETFINFVNGW